MTSLQPDFCKTFMPHDCTGLVELMGGHLTTLFESGNIKTAASDLFTRKDLDDHAPDKDHFMIHQIVMGSQEKWGYNNNADGFPDEGLRRDHPTFVTHGHVYREHRNHSPKLKIGDIKSVKYSTKMGRVETLKHIRIDKAEKEYQMAKEGKEIFASMACRVPSDTCSCCGHQAKYASLYCNHLRDHMGQWMPEFKKYAFAINPEATYFDDSIVDNPAARMARHIEYRFGPQDQHLKAASQRPVLSGAQWAEFGMRHGSLNPASQQLLQKLASLEAQPPDVWRTSVSQYAFDKEARLRTPDWDQANRLLPGTFFRKLASRGVLLPFDHFCSYVTGRTVPDLQQDPDFHKEASGLSSLFRSLSELLEQEECCCGQPDLDMFSACGSGFADVDPSSCDSIDRIMDQAADNWSAEVEPVQRRSVQIIAVKKASVWVPPGRHAISPLAVMYGMYKMAALQDIQKLSRHVHPDLLLACAVDQNLEQAQSISP